jgi:hypothetical protein
LIIDKKLAEPNTDNNDDDSRANFDKLFCNLATKINPDWKVLAELSI